MSVISNIYYGQPIEPNDDNAMIVLKKSRCIHVDDNDLKYNVPGFVYKKWLANFRLNEELKGGNNV
jgi:hypothetical protein